MANIGSFFEHWPVVILINNRNIQADWTIDGFPTYICDLNFKLYEEKGVNLLVNYHSKQRAIENVLDQWCCNQTLPKIPLAVHSFRLGSDQCFNLKDTKLRSRYPLELGNDVFSEECID